MAHRLDPAIKPKASIANLSQYKYNENELKTVRQVPCFKSTGKTFRVSLSLKVQEELLQWEIKQVK